MTATERIDKWNDAHPIGTRVIVTLDNGNQTTGRTRSPAWKPILSGDYHGFLQHGVLT